MRRLFAVIAGVLLVGAVAFGAWWRLRAETGEPVGDAASVLCGGISATRTGRLPQGLDEVSGLVASREQPGVLWVHNDSGDDARVYAIRGDGSLVATVEVAGASAYDWEDMAIVSGPEAGDDTLYMGDMGDNREERRDIAVYKVSEPDVAAVPDGAAAPEGAERVSTSEPATRFVLRFPDGAHDAETLLADPVSGDLYVITKDLQGRSGVYRAAAIDGGSVGEMDLVVTLDLGAGGLATAGDITAAGDAIAVRTYLSVFVWGRREGETVAEAFRRAPCRAPRPADLGGEAFGFDPDGRGYTTTVEGEGSPIRHWAG